MKRPPDLEQAWRAYHVYYHADQDRLLGELVLPLVSTLASEGLIERFYFVRYELNGPHVRLRWRLSEPAAATRVEETLAEHAADFLGRHPSRAPIPEAEIRRLNRMVREHDPLAGAEPAELPRDNSWMPAPTAFEVERYGGPARVAASLDLFTIGSVHVLRALAQSRSGDGGGWVRSAFLRLSLRLAVGLAESPPELVELSDYATRLLGDDYDRCRAEADERFDRQRQRLTDLVRTELARERRGFEAAAYSVARVSSGLPREHRLHLAASHLHMTANRLGISNPEEVYLSRLLGRAVACFRAQDEPAWRTAWARRDQLAAEAERLPLGRRAAAALVELTPPLAEATR